jgi:hypothetical protein
MQGITAEKLGRAVGMRLALELLADMQRAQPGGQYPEHEVRERVAEKLRDEQQAWRADGQPLSPESDTVAFQTMMVMLDPVIDKSGSQHPRRTTMKSGRAKGRG